MVIRKCSKAEQDAEGDGVDYEHPADHKERIFHRLCHELRDSLVQAAREDIVTSQKRFGDA